ncbi:hypothetical protein JRQ81_007000 [Phrynocephalus forsythii]|uniref:Uncharacterized protein n=1 Tax=Phrynocephalus forsythii TaxID=171643 RepID=A0A9Q0XE94_9SAUR|nr:hypothetical protein JRQ81_007000 [Phrynocephalus forsythii]
MAALNIIHYSNDSLKETLKGFLLHNGQKHTDQENPDNCPPPKKTRQLLKDCSISVKGRLKQPKMPVHTAPGNHPSSTGEEKEEEKENLDVETFLIVRFFSWHAGRKEGKGLGAWPNPYCPCTLWCCMVGKGFW